MFKGLFDRYIGFLSLTFLAIIALTVRPFTPVLCQGVVSKQTSIVLATNELNLLSVGLKVFTGVKSDSDEVAKEQS